MPLDYVSWDGLLAFYYVALAVALVLSIVALKKFRGNSLLAITVISLTLQVGLSLVVLPRFVEEGPKNIIQPAFTRMGVALILFYLISSATLGFYIAFFKEAQKTPAPPRQFSPLVFLVALLLALGFVAYRIHSGSAQAVFNQGTDVLSDSQAYYSLRGELIQINLEDSNPLMLQFEQLGRKFLYIILLATSYLAARKRAFSNFVLLGAVTAVLVVDEMIRFQKAPIMIVLAGALVPYILFRGKPVRTVLLRRILQLAFVFVVLLALSAGTVVLTTDYSVDEVLFAVWQRFFSIPAYTTSMYFHVYPETNPFVNFGGIRVLTWIFGLQESTFSGSIPVDVGMAMSGKAYDANACMVADGWAKGGYIGVFLMTVVMCGLFVAVDRWVDRVRKHVDILPLLVFYWFGFVSIGNLSLPTVISSNGLWIVPFIYPFLFQSARQPLVLEEEDTTKPEPGDPLLLVGGMLKQGPATS